MAGNSRIGVIPPPSSGGEERRSKGLAAIDERATNDPARAASATRPGPVARRAPTAATIASNAVNRSNDPSMPAQAPDRRNGQATARRL